MAQQSGEGNSPAGRLQSWFGLRGRTELILFLVLLLLALFSRFYHLGDRVMSHDEGLHTYYSFQLRNGDGFFINPLMHGPLQDHLIATSFFLFGDSDTTARIPAAIAGVASVVLIFTLRRWLTKRGAWFAATLMLVSPFMLYYSRYVRNEGLIVPITLLMFLAIFSYFETRQSRWLYLFVFSMALHFSAKETAFLYSAGLLVFLGSLFVIRVLKSTWKREVYRWMFIIGLIAAVIGLTVMLGMMFYELYTSPGYYEGGQVTADRITYGLPVWVSLGSGITGLILLILGLALDKGRRLVADYPTFNLIVVMATLILPFFAALFQPDAMNYQDPNMVQITMITVGILLATSIAVGLVWDWKRWLISAGIFYGIFLTLFTVLFTQMTGIAIGLVGSLGYWLQQHEVSRGGQPWYYYLLIQLPVYEFVGMIGAFVAGAIGLTRWLKAEDVDDSEPKDATDKQTFPALAFLAFWALAAFALFSFAGERMPWLTVHITLPLILLAGWGFGQTADSFDWGRLRNPRSWLIPAATVIFVLALLGLVGRLLGAQAPFQGKALEQLAATNSFLALLVAAAISGYGLYRLLEGWPKRQVALLFSLIMIVLGYGLSARAAAMASYVNYNQATEFLVYAHGGEGVKDAIQQIEEISIDTTNGLAIEVAYDEDVRWPINWYLRKFPNQVYIGNLTSDFVGFPLILVGDDYFSDADSLLSDSYEVFEFNRMVWPTQDYYNLTADRISNALTSPEYRHALWDIWFNRDYTRYGQITGRDFSSENWSPADRMRLYVRQDIMAKMWEMGAAPVAMEEFTYVDPYVGRMTFIDPAVVYGGRGGGPGQFEQPRDIAIGPDGSLYVVDSGNHRIQHLSIDGEVLNVWGSYGDANQTDAPGGTFNQPWGIAVDDQGNVYVADTWNHRIQVFTSEGVFIEMFGVFDNPTTPESYWGPRDVHIDSDGNLYVVDTGNKRIVVFNSDREYVGEFGIGGYALGELDEPVGITVADDGMIYLADTWNLRIQVFEELQPGDFIAVREWEIDGWLGQSLDNKPYLDIYEDILCATDPEGFRVLCFNPDGEFLMGWGEGSINTAQFGVLNGLVFDDQGGLWVTDSTNGRLYYFSDIPSHVIIDT